MGIRARPSVPEVPVVPPSGAAARVQTAVPLDRLTALNDALAQVPAGFTVHKKLERGRERKKLMLATPDEPTIDLSLIHISEPTRPY